MLVIMLHKLWQKKWMNLCLLIGCILLVATAVSFPLYRKAAYDRMLQNEFANALAEEGNWPMVLSMSAKCEKNKTGKIGRMESYAADMYGVTGLAEYDTIYTYSLLSSAVASSVHREDAEDMTLSLSAMSELTAHAQPVAGRFYSDTGLADDGAIEVIVSQNTLTQKGLILGETLTFKKLADADGQPVTIRIVGVYTGERAQDVYFQKEPEQMSDVCMMHPSLFRALFTGDNAVRYTITVTFYNLFDYRAVSADDVEHINRITDWMFAESSFKGLLKEPSYREMLAQYALKKNRITATLLILQIPVLVLLASFLLMISGQMYEMERNEISVIKSRGSFRGQILLLYFYQGLFLSLLGAALGLPLGSVFAGILGAARSFLEFDARETLPVVYTREACLYAAVAMLINLLCICIPAIRHSSVSIVKLKQSQAVRKKSLWEKLFLDLILIGISLYGYFSFRGRMSDVSEQVLAGDSLDPLMIASSSVFIVGAGLLFLRLQPLIVRLFYLCVKKICGPAGYISFMENIRNCRKMHLIMLFLIMTIALGMFDATVARTILENAVRNTDYLDGAGLIIKEQWLVMVYSNGTSTGVYSEPDPEKYMAMPFADAFTKVVYDEDAYLRKSKSDRTPALLMGIHTREFGEMTALDNSLNPKTYHTLLNELAETENGVLLSRNFETAEGVKPGDSFSYYTGAGKSVAGKVVDFVDYFPSYAPKSAVIHADGTAETNENYLIVANYAWLKKSQGVQPYEIWIDLKDGATQEDIYTFITDHRMRVTKYLYKASDIQRTETDPLLQGTNGVLTLGFVVTLLLCAVGYLIYWILSVRERELLFGVLRACGMHKSEVMRMLLYEQFFTGLFSVLAGIGIGRLTSRMYVPIVQTSYATAEQVLPLRLITRASDLYRLYGFVALVMLVSMAALVWLLSRMNVTGALKLGEE